ncbi:Kin of IRRE-like protein 1 [Holothuria leucospilota]|uniref:Kin of IRRE-like protein 1 n=1 Tax=Holothuria leucospilota TaxID=206669 RepID=A0A9Q1CCX6_HOLLE|nr:Kin of IRRE-like protein 1 [Holothuria leucospilota]
MAATLCLILTVLSILFGFANSELQFRTQPQQKTALAGADVTLPCIVEDLQPRHAVLWYRAEFLIARNTDITTPQDSGRITVAADRTIGQFDLHISNVAPSDDMTYKCAVLDTTTDQEVLQSSPIRLEIESTPGAEYPKCIEPPDKTEYLEGEEISMNCTSERANPPVSILWYQGGTQIKSMKPMLDVNGFRTATYTFVVEPRYNGAVFQCKLTTEAIPGYEKSCTIGPLSVVYQPRVTLVRDQESYQEGEIIQLTCEADANPEPFQYKWSSFLHEENHSFQFSQNDKVVVFPASLDMNGDTLACNATNRYGYSVSNSVTLRITPKPAEAEVTDPNPSTDSKERKKKIQIDFVAKATQPSPTGLNNWLLLLIIAILSLLIIVLFIVLVLQVCRNYQANSSNGAIYSGASAICNGNNIDRAWDQTSVYFEPQDQISVVYDPAWTRQNSQSYQGQRNIGVQVPFVEEPHYAEIELDWDEEHGTLEL